MANEDLSAQKKKSEKTEMEDSAKCGSNFTILTTAHVTFQKAAKFQLS
jgi:hypothetical protein